MVLAEFRSKLQALREAGRDAECASLAWRYLAHAPQDEGVAAWTLSYLLRAGLGGPARELADHAARSGAAANMLNGLQAALRSAPAGRVSWQDQRGVFMHHAPALHQCLQRSGWSGSAGEFNTLLQQALTGIHLYCTAAGAQLLSRRPAGGWREWLPFITDYAPERSVALPAWDGVSAVIIDGLSLGPLLDRVWASTSDLGVHKSLPVLIVEPDLWRLAAWLHTADRTALLASERVFLFAGPAAMAEFEQFLKSHDTIAAAAMCTITPPGLPNHYAAIEAIWQRFQAHYQQELSAIKEALTERYRKRSVEYWRRRLERLDSVIGLTSRSTTMLRYATRDIGRAFEDLGCTFHQVMEEADHHRLTPLRVLRKIWETDPGLVVMVDHLRYEYGGLLFNIPVLTWIQDPLPNLLCPQAGASIGPLDFVCGYYERQCCTEFGYPREHFFQAPLPVSGRVFHDGPVSRAGQPPPTCDLIYVGHLSRGVAEVRAEWRGQTPERLHPLLDRIDERIEALLRHGEHLVVDDSEALVRPLAAEMGLELEDAELRGLGHFYAYRVFDIGFRIETLRWAVRWAEECGRTLRIHGRGWQEVAELRPYAMGPIEHGEPLRQAYRSAHLALQAMPGGFMHQRCYEALASGGLVLARYSPTNFSVTREQFEALDLAAEGYHCACLEFPDLERVVFRSAAELRERAEFYLQNPEQRRRTVAEFRQIVMRKYSYESVVPGVLSRIVQAMAADAQPEHTGMHDEHAERVPEAKPRPAADPPSGPDQPREGTDTGGERAERVSEGSSDFASDPGAGPDHEVVFVRGTGRCGSRTLVQWLGEHPGLARVPVNETLPEALIDWSLDHLPGETPSGLLGAACRAYFSAYARGLAGGSGRLVQKSTMQAHQLDTLLRYWPHGRIIYLVRHPLGVVQSMINIDIHEFHGRYGVATVANALLRWYNDIDTYLRSAAFQHPRVLQVHFEDLVHDPAATLADIDRFLGLPPGQRPQAAGASSTAGRDDYADRFVLNGRERQWIIASTAEIVRRLGYPSDGFPAGSVDGGATDRSAEPPDRHAHRRLRGIPPALDGAELVRLALARAANAGFRRAALFGAGYLARLVGPRLGPCATQVVCLCDDDSARLGRRLAGWTICRPEDVERHGAEVAIPVTLVHQAALIDRWRRISPLPIIPLWDESGEAPANPTAARPAAVKRAVGAGS